MTQVGGGIIIMWHPPLPLGSLFLCRSQSLVSYISSVVTFNHGSASLPVYLFWCYVCNSFPSLSNEFNCHLVKDLIRFYSFFFFLLILPCLSSSLTTKTTDKLTEQKASCMSTEHRKYIEWRRRGMWQAITHGKHLAEKWESSVTLANPETNEKMHKSWAKPVHKAYRPMKVLTFWQSNVSGLTQSHKSYTRMSSQSEESSSWTSGENIHRNCCQNR